MRSYCTAGLALVLILLLRGACPASAQTSIGFEDPGDIRPVLDYRLPSWGYTAASMELRLEGRGEDDWGITEYDRLSGRLDLQPDLSWYRESELQTALIDLQLDGSWSGSKQDGEGREDRWEQLLLGYEVEGRFDHYIRPNTFVFIGANTSGDYYEHTDESRCSHFHQQPPDAVGIENALVPVGYGVTHAVPHVKLSV